MLATVAGHQWGQATAMALIGFAAWLASHTALTSTTRAKIGDWLLPGKFRRHGKRSFRFTAGVGAVLVGALAAIAFTDPAITSWWWLGIPVAWGCLAHSLGDALTYSAVPLWWPLEIRGCRWAPVGTPRWMRFRTGSRVETCVVAVMAVAGAISMYVLSNAP
ncbi:metal-dependent hydrolase [Actinoplanes sp. CA-051413]|uniref:metal-dependent hydrolase n=1 Tax=Actinoplanes sp. CA-051413 TaxID=3239899 RepID=UPI003D993C82